MVTEDQLRGVLQLPARPTSETILFTGDRYYDLSHFEPLSVYSLIGTNGSTSGYSFNFSTDYTLTNGVLDFGGGANTPLLGTTFQTDYSYSPLGEATVSTSMWIASTTVYQELASNFPYGSNSAAGVAYNDLATYGTIMIAAARCCDALAASEVENAVKYRRGSIQVDETLKSKYWAEQSVVWESRYEKYINMIRPAGRPSGIMAIVANAYSLVFPSDAYAFGVASMREIAAYESFGLNL